VNALDELVPGQELQEPLGDDFWRPLNDPVPWLSLITVIFHFGRPFDRSNVPGR
jgi:hypothetical protein